MTAVKVSDAEEDDEQDQVEMGDGVFVAQSRR